MMHSIPPNLTNRNSILPYISEAFRGRGASLNKEILRVLSIRGPLTIYEIWKELSRGRPNLTYSVVHRRVKKLLAFSPGALYPAMTYSEPYRKGKFLVVVGSRRADKTGQKIYIYGLTLKGIILSLFVIDYKEHLNDILKNNNHIPLINLINKLIKKYDIKIINEIFFEGIKELLSNGLINIDVITDYLLLGWIGMYLRNRAKEKFSSLIKKDSKVRTLIDKLTDLRKIAIHENIDKWLKDLTFER